MKIKKSFLIKGKPWTVEYKWGLRLDDKLVDGYCDLNKRVIYLRRELGVDDKFLTFLHELTHAIFSEAHVSDHEGGVDGILEEVLCDSIADVFTQLFSFRWKRRRPQ